MQRENGGGIERGRDLGLRISECVCVCRWQGHNDWGFLFNGSIFCYKA